MLRLVPALLLASVCCLGSYAQVRRRVLDPSKAPVAQAAIQVASPGGKTVFQGASDSAGNFAIPLAPGKYQLHVHKDGFENRDIPIALSSAGKQITVVLSLQTQTVSVTVSDQSNSTRPATLIRMP